jgi:hypothetical protein
VLSCPFSSPFCHHPSFVLSIFYFCFDPNIFKQKVRVDTHSAGGMSVSQTQYTVRTHNIYEFWGEEMSIFTKERRMNLIRGMYKLRRKEPRITITDMAASLGISRNAATHHLNRALEEGILFNPQLRLLMSDTIKEYSYAISSDDAFNSFHKLQEDNRILYEIFGSGYADLLLTTTEPISWSELDELGKVMLWGERSNYICPKVPNTDYLSALSNIEDFSQKDFEKSQWDIPVTPWEIEWKEIDWKLYPLLRYDVTKTYTELAKKVEMSYDGFRWSFRRILTNTQLIVPFYPEGYFKYSDFFFFIQTKYEKMFIDMFSLMPCFTMINKVRDWLSISLHILPLNVTDRLFTVLYSLQDQGYLKKLKMVYSVTYWCPDP